MGQTFLYVAQGRINLKEPDRPARVIESKFGQSLVDRATQIQQRNAWKTQGTGAKFMSGRMLWGGSPEEQEQGEIPVVVDAVCRGSRPNEVLYSLATAEIGGVFSVNCNNGDERRLLHTADFRVGQLTANASEDKVACVVRSRAGSHIAVMRGDGSDLSDVTQGDSFDTMPVWQPGSANELIFQSAGIARNPAGVIVGTSASHIVKLDIEAGSTCVLLGDEEHDYLDPKMDSSGNLYCIRKPYVSPKTGFNPFRAALDLVMLPFRLLFAFFQFMNFFTMRYTGNTLVTSGDMRQKPVDMRQMMVMDNLMHARRAKDLFGLNGKGWKVSRSWTLIRKPPEGELEVIEKAVLTFDIFDDGSLLCTDGSRIFLREPDGGKTELLRDQFISQVLAMPGGNSQ